MRVHLAHSYLVLPLSTCSYALLYTVSYMYLLYTIAPGKSESCLLCRKDIRLTFAWDHELLGDWDNVVHCVY